ncbi:MAG: CRISPR-associated protein Csx3 [Patescibacteria group bacterium]
MTTYNITRNGDTLKIGFGAPAQNDQIVKDVVAHLTEMESAGELNGGGVIKINGPASLPVAVAITHAVLHKFSAVGVFDPKLNKYVIAATHDPAYAVGDLIE